MYWFPKPAPIVSRKSEVQVPTGVAYASLTGLVLPSERRTSQISSPWYSWEYWKAMLPHTMIGASVEGQCVGFTCNRGFLFGIRDGVDNDGITDNDLMPITFTPNALHTTRDGKRYLAFGNVIHEWDSGAEFMPYCWRSETTAAPGQGHFFAAKVTFSSYPAPRIAPFGVRFRFIADARAVFERPVKHSKPFRLPPN